MPPAAELYAENLALKARVGSLAEQIGGLEERVAVLLQQIAWFKRKLFGGGQSEKLTAVDAAQLQLALAELAELTAPAAKTETISYERAKAESLGLQAKGGLMERAERIILLCLGLLFDNLLVPILWIMLVLTSITAVQRFIKVWKQAAVAPATEVKIEERLARRETKHAVRQERRHSNRRPSSR